MRKFVCALNIGTQVSLLIFIHICFFVAVFLYRYVFVLSYRESLGDSLDSEPDLPLLSQSYTASDSTRQQKTSSKSSLRISVTESSAPSSYLLHTGRASPLGSPGSHRRHASAPVHVAHSHQRTGRGTGSESKVSGGAMESKVPDGGSKKLFSSPELSRDFGTLFAATKSKETSE